MTSWFQAIISRFAALFRRKDLEKKLQEELDFHLEMQVEENLRNGMKPEEARNSALRSFGGLDQAKEKYRDGRSLRYIEDFIQDIRHGLRIFRRNPGFSLTVILTLALGIGANTAVVSVMDALIFRPLPFGQIDRLVEIPPGLNYLNYLDIREQDRIFSDVAAVMGLPVSGRSAGSGNLTGRAVSANFFRVVGLPMTLGRGFLPEEETLSGNSPVAVISHRFWETDYGSDPAVIGKTVKRNNESLTIGGVAPKDLLGDLGVGGEYHDLWVPIPMFPRIIGIADTPMWKDAIGNRNIYPYLSIFGRLKPEITLDQAKARMAVFVSNHQNDHPQSIQDDQKPLLVPLNEARWPKGDLLFPSIILTAASVCIFLITCTNVAGLLLARGAVRQREIATRLAVGAGHERVVRQLLSEGFALSAIALVPSLAIYHLALQLCMRLNPFNISSFYADLGIDSRTISFAICIGLLAVLLFGLAPALATAGGKISSALKVQSLSYTGTRKVRGYRMLIVFQIGLTVVLLISAGLFGRTIWHFVSADHGLDGNVLIISHGEDSYEPDRVARMTFFQSVLDRLHNLSGVRSAAWGLEEPFDPNALMIERIRPDSPAYVNDEWFVIQGDSVSPGYFRTLGIPILQGRAFTDQDRQNPSGTVVVNETFSQRFWPGETAVGKHIRIRRHDPDEFRAQGPELCEVIGIAKDAKYDQPWEEKMPFIYFPYWHWFYNAMSLYVSVDGNPYSMINPIRSIYEEEDPDIRIAEIVSISDQLKSLLSQERSAGFVLGVFGAFGLILASVGLYGIISYSVAQRTREFGIRMALGAKHANIVGREVFQGISLALIGLGAGLPVSAALSRFLASRMHGLSPLDPTTYVAVSALCLVVASFASFLSARRAAGNPMDALRVE
jgi:putative ABC transport system permease protein